MVKTRAPERIPPHNLDAERSILGAALLSDRAAEILSTSTQDRDYYQPAHQHIASAIRTLAATDAPVDVTTVGDMLRRAGVHTELDGGLAYLHELQNATPTVSAAAHYARIVRDTSTLRQLISAASEITALAYSEPDDPTAAISRAGALVDGLAGQALAELSSWEVADIAALLETDLEPEQPSILRRTDGGALFYPGKLHALQAEPSSGKSFIALAVVAEILAMGGAAIYLDFEDTAAGITRRLLQVGASPAAVAARFEYRQLLGRFGTAEKLNLAKSIDRLNPDVVIIDGVAEALTREGLSEDKADDVVRWADMFPRPLARSGSAVVMLDHVAKDPEQRGRWARGSGAKLAVVDGATYQVKVKRSFSRHRSGRVDLIIAKDRPGGVGAIGETAAEVHVEPHGAGERVVLRFEPHLVEASPTDSFRPTIVMGRLWHELDSSSVPLTAGALLALVHTDKVATKKEALARLQHEGYVAEATGKPKTLRIVKVWEGADVATRNGDQAPAWRQPPPELFEHDDAPTPDELADLDAQRPFYDQPEY